MADLLEEIQKEIESLKQVRDELRVKADLAKMETRDQWQVIEKKWQRRLPSGECDSVKTANP